MLCDRQAAGTHRSGVGTWRPIDRADVVPCGNRAHWVLISLPPEADTDSPAAPYVRTNDCSEGDTALLKAEMAFKDGCLTVVDDAGQGIVPAFPSDFTWDAEAGELSGFGHTFAAGDPTLIERKPTALAVRT